MYVTYRFTDLSLILRTGLDSKSNSVLKFKAIDEAVKTITIKTYIYLFYYKEKKQLFLPALPIGKHLNFLDSYAIRSVKAEAFLFFVLFL